MAVRLINLNCYPPFLSVTLPIEETTGEGDSLLSQAYVPMLVGKRNRLARVIAMVT